MPDQDLNNALTSCRSREAWEVDCQGSLLKDCADGLVIKPRPICHQFLSVIRLHPVKDFEKPSSAPGEPAPNLEPFATGRFNQDFELANPNTDSLRSFLNESIVALGSNFQPNKGKLPPKKPRGKQQRAATPAARSAWGDIFKLVNDAVEEYLKEVENTADAAVSHYPATQPVKLAMMLRFDQCWLSKGYLRGDLLHSTTLCPKEELTIEIFTWDRRRLEQEKSVESGREFSQSGTFTVRASHDIATAIQLKMGGEAYGEAGGKLSMAEAGLPIDANGKIGLKLTTALATSIETKTNLFSEATRTASDTYRETRKTRILETAEVGREIRTTRKLKNANPCHPVTYYTFEIVEDFEVCTAPSGGELVAVIPLPKRGLMDRSWILANEFPLRQALLDPVYERGFEAAKKLLSAKLFRRFVTPPPINVTQPPTNPQRDTLRESLEDLIRDIRDTSEELDGASLSQGEILAALNVFDSGHDAAIKEAGKVATKNLILSVYSGLFDRVDELVANTLDANEEPSTPVLFQRLSAFLQKVLETGVLSVVTRPLKLEVLPLLVLPFDDCGLIGTLDYALNQIKTIEPAVQAQLGAATLPGGSSSEGNGAPVEVPSDPVQRAIDDRYGLDALADARVEFNRLVDHIDDHLDYYLTVLYTAAGRQGWDEILRACPQARPLVEPRLLGFHNGYALFPLKPHVRAKHDERLLQVLLSELSSNSKFSTLDCVTLPTTGTVTTARVEACSACEESVGRQRDAEARTAEAKARMAELEADRYAQRLTVKPPQLDDPTPDAAKLSVEIHKREHAHNGGLF